MRNWGFSCRKISVSSVVGGRELVKDPRLDRVIWAVTAPARGAPNVIVLAEASSTLWRLRSSPNSPTRSRTMPLCDIKCAHSPLDPGELCKIWKNFKYMLRDVQICLDILRYVEWFYDMLINVQIFCNILRYVKICCDISRYFDSEHFAWFSQLKLRSTYSCKFTTVYMAKCG